MAALAAMARQTHVPTSDHLRRRIDHGELGDKVNFPDPAAAPLGTDDEAAGHPPTAYERALAAEQPAPAPHPRRGRMAFIALMLLIIILAMVSLSALLWR
jgi:hypothetical protein